MPRRKSFEAMNCSVAQCLEVVGEWWSLLIVRDALMGISRFDDFEARLGISRNVLTQRLDHLVGCGVLEREAYQDHPVRYDYRLSKKGRELWKVLEAMRHWGDQWAAPGGEPAHLVHDTCGEITTAVAVCSSCGERLYLRDLHLIPGPGGGDLPLQLPATHAH